MKKKDPQTDLYVQGMPGAIRLDVVNFSGCKLRRHPVLTESQLIIKVEFNQKYRVMCLVGYNVTQRHTQRFLGIFVNDFIEFICCRIRTTLNSEQ